jgi:excisionase family DNA binding protein
MLTDTPPAGPLAPAKSPCIEPLLIPDTAAASLLGISRAHLHRLRAAGKFPEAIRLGRALRFDRAELVAWAEARCPDLPIWRAMKDAARRNGRPR